jgi:Fe-S-cluster-containing hydrogenase component 2
MLKTICPHYCPDCYAANVCAVHAVTSDHGSIGVDLSKCIGCGCCKTTCVAFGFQALEKSKPWEWVKPAA